jgi:hypothetical protein
MHSTTIGASRARSATCSTRSRKVASAHWRSSTTTTSGRRRAIASNSRRTAQKIFSLVAPVEPPWPTASDTTSAIASACGSSASWSTSGSGRPPTISASGQNVMPSP